MNSLTPIKKRKVPHDLRDWQFQLGFTDNHMNWRAKTFKFGIFKITSLPPEGEMIGPHNYKGFWVFKDFYIPTFQIVHKFRNSFESKWISFWFGRGFEISFAICGYFDNRPQIHLSFVFFHLIIKLPFRNSWTSECDSPKWGISYHGQMFWIHRGGKGNMNGGSRWWAFEMPWAYTWVRTSMLRKDGEWEHDTKKTPKSFYQDEWKDILWSETHPYTYTLNSGVDQHRMATIRLEEREWRMRAFQWMPYLARIQKTIDIDFDGEVGEGTGSWKGGTLGCGYELLPNETPQMCLKRMETEREFDR